MSDFEIKNSVELVAEQVEQKHLLEQKVKLLKAIMLDIFLVFYSYITIERVLINKFLLQRKDVPFFWSDLILPLVVSIIIGISWGLSKTSVSTKLLGIGKKTAIAKYSSEVFGWFLFNITFIAGWILTKISIVDLFSPEGIRGAGRIFGALFKPGFNIFDTAVFATIETIYIALLATVLSIPLTLLLSFLTAKNLMSGNKVLLSLYYFIRIVLNFIRSVEPLIWAIIFSVWIGIGPFAGMMALLIHTIASNAKLYSEAIEGIEAGPVEAIEATGANKLQVIWYAVVPQILLPFLSFTIYRWDINVRMATVIGLVGGGGIGTMLIQYQGLAQWNEVGLIVLMIAFVVWIMDYISAKIRESIY